MKGKLVITVMVGLIILSCFSIPTFAGVDATPWHSQLNRLESVMNGLDSIMRRLDDVLTPPDPAKLRRPAEEGVMGRLEAMANQLEVLNDRIMAAMTGVPMDPLPSGIAMALMDINEDAMEIAEMARMGFNPPFDGQGVHDALMEVEMNALMIIRTVNSYMPSLQ